MKYAKAEDIVSNANAQSHWIENFNHMRNISDKRWGYKKISIVKSMTLHVFNGAFGIKHVNSFINMKLNPPPLLIKFEIEILINIHTKKIQSSM